MLSENVRLNSPSEMRCYYCEALIEGEHFPRADEDGSALCFDSPSGESVQYFAHRSCAVTAGHSAQRIGDIGVADELLLAPAARAEVLRRAFRVGWVVDAHFEPGRYVNVYHIILNDPDSEGFQRHYWAQFVEGP